MFDITKLTRLRFYILTNTNDYSGSSRSAYNFRGKKRRAPETIVIDGNSEEDDKAQNIKTNFEQEELKKEVGLADATHIVVNENNDFTSIGTNDTDSLQNNEEIMFTYADDQGVYYDTYDEFIPEFVLQNNEVLPLSEGVYEDFDTRLLVLHRGRVFEELIQQVNDFEVSSKTTVQVEMFTLNGSQEGACHFRTQIQKNLILNRRILIYLKNLQNKCLQ